MQVFPLGWRCGMRNLNHPSNVTTWLSFRTSGVRNLYHPHWAATWLSFGMPRSGRAGLRRARA